MKNLILLCCCLCAFEFNYAQVNEAHDLTPKARVRLAPQGEFVELSGSAYQEVRGDQDPHVVNKPLYVVYNSKYALLSVAGQTTYFDIDPTYTRESVDGEIVEEFINAKAESNPRGWYSFHIVHEKTGKTSLTINLPMVSGGCAYIIDAAKTSGANGVAINKAHADDWQELEDRAKEADSIKSGLKKPLTYEEKELNKGDSKYMLTKEDFLKLKKALTTVIPDPHGSFTVKIDKAGYVKDITVSYLIFKDGDGEQGLKVVDKYNQTINAYFKQHKYQVPQFTVKGKPYPATIYMDVLQEQYK